MMRRYHIAIITIILFSVLMLGCSRDAGKGRKKSIDFTLTDLEGQSFTLYDNKGKVIVMDFWATWCAPCRSEIPELIKISNEYKEKGVIVIGIGLDDKERLADFSREYNINYDILVGTQDIAKRYGVKGIPTTYILDKTGRIVKKFVGYMPGMEKEIKKAIDEALKE
jgi:thiol-disulfide isomerase/thioredoxin